MIRRTLAGGRPGMFLAALGLAILSFGCGADPGRHVIRMASTTSLYDTGLLDELVAAFSAEHPAFTVHVVAVGTGQALALGERRDADLLFVHAPGRERSFVEAGHGLGRITIMRNDFVIAGPENDPAGVAGTEDALGAFRAIRDAGATFASRGDDSGTHIRELSIWREAGLTPDWPGYLEVGQGMGATLMVAAERSSYTLADRATLNVLRANGIDLVDLLSGGPELRNEYSLIRVAGASEPEGAERLESWLRSEAAAAIIRDFGRERFGEPLFFLVGQ